MGEKMRKINVFETVVLVAIVLVVIQTFLEDFAVVSGWNPDVRWSLVLSGLFFDLFFTIEFLVRLILAARKKQVKLYLLYRRGWVDFFASVPLLLLNSGPAVLSHYLYGTAGGVEAVGVANVLKIAKIIRVTRILRLIRVLKIFGKIRNTDSSMANRHIGAITTTAVFSVVVVMLFTPFLPSIFPSFHFSVDSRIAYYKAVITEPEIVKVPSSPFSALLGIGGEKEKIIHPSVLFKAPDIVQVEYQGKVLKQMSREDVYRARVFPDDFAQIDVNGYKIVVDILPLKAENSKVMLLVFFIILTITLSFMVAYAKHFAQTVSDPVYVVLKGIEDPDFLLEAKVREEFAEDEVFQLARAYNEKILSEKLIKVRKQRGRGSRLSIEDILGDNLPVKKDETS